MGTETHKAVDGVELKRLAEAATPGPWEWREESESDQMMTLSPGILVLDNDFGCGGPWGDSIDRANAAYIAAANPSAILSLLDTLSRQSEALAGMREAIIAAIDPAVLFERHHPQQSVAGLLRQALGEPHVG